MIRKTIFIAIIVLIVFLIYRGISPSGADKLINKISSIREKNNITIQSGNLYTGNEKGGLNSSGTNEFEKIVKSGTLLELSGKENKEISTGTNIKTGSATTKKKPTTQTTTKTNGLGQQDINDLKNLLNNIVE